MREWKRKTALLEQGISPDGLPINPPRTTRQIFLSAVRGWFSYWWVDSAQTLHKSWYGIGTVS